VSSSVNTSDLVELVSPLSFELTLSRVRTAIEGAGLKIFAVIDHAAGAAAAGLALPPATVLVYGRAEGGTPLMAKTPNLALDLPLRVLVRAEPGGRSIVAFRPIALTFAQAGVPDEMLHRLDPAQRLLSDLFAGP